MMLTMLTTSVRLTHGRHRCVGMPVCGHAMGTRGRLLSLHHFSIFTSPPSSSLFTSPPSAQSSLASRTPSIVDRQPSTIASATGRFHSATTYKHIREQSAHAPLAAYHGQEEAGRLWVRGVDGPAVRHCLCLVYLCSLPVLECPLSLHCLLGPGGTATAQHACPSSRRRMGESPGTAPCLRPQHTLRRLHVRERDTNLLALALLDLPKTDALNAVLQRMRRLSAQTHPWGQVLGRTRRAA